MVSRSFPNHACHRRSATVALVIALLLTLVFASAGNAADRRQLVATGPAPSQAEAERLDPTWRDAVRAGKRPTIAATPTARPPPPACWVPEAIAADTIVPAEVSRTAHPRTTVAMLGPDTSRPLVSLGRDRPRGIAEAAITLSEAPLLD